MTNHTVAPTKQQEKAKKSTFKARYGALIDRTSSDLSYDAAQKAMLMRTVQRLDRGVAA